MLYITKSEARINPAHVTHIDSETFNERLYWYAYLVSGAKIRISPDDVEGLELCVNEFLYALAPKSSVI